MPAHGFAPSPFRSAIAACLLLPGQPGRTAITGLHAHRSALAAGAVLRALAGSGHDSVLTAISCLAGYLDTYGSPIDYQRRRDLIPASTITAGQWRDLCYSAAAHPGEARRHRDAQRYLFQLLTGTDPHDPGTPSRSPAATTTAATTPSPTPSPPGCGTHCTPTPPGSWTTWASASRSPGPRRPAAAPAWTCPGPSQATSTWTPPDASSSPAGSPSPGPPRGWAPLPATSGSRSSTSPGPRGSGADPPRPRHGQRRQRARAVLTPEFFEREYIGAGKNLRQLEAGTGIPRRFLSQVAREHGITMTGTRGPAPADPGWLHERGVTGPRSGTGRPAEPGGQIPGDIGRAAQDSPAGWQRLRRFQIAMAYPAIAAAAPPAHLPVRAEPPAPPARTRHRRQALPARHHPPAMAADPPRRRAADRAGPARRPGPRRRARPGPVWLRQQPQPLP